MTYDPRGWVRALVRAVLTDAQLERLGRAAVARNPKSRRPPPRVRAGRRQRPHQ